MFLNLFIKIPVGFWLGDAVISYNEDLWNTIKSAAALLREHFNGIVHAAINDSSTEEAKSDGD